MRQVDQLFLPTPWKCFCSFDIQNQMEKVLLRHTQKVCSPIAPSMMNFGQTLIQVHLYVRGDHFQAVMKPFSLLYQEPRAV